MSIQFLGTRAPTNPYRLSPYMVGALIGSWPDGDGFQLRSTLAMKASQARLGLQRRNLVELRNDKWMLTEDGVRERARLVEILEEDDHL